MNADKTRPGHVDVVVGLQFGSEGKGAFCHYLAETRSYEVSARTGGPQAGHTVKLRDGTEKAFHSLPVAAVVPEIELVIPAGAVVDPAQLLSELDWCEEAGIGVRDRLYVDEFATVLRPEHIEEESARKLQQRIGGTGRGVGAATAAHVWREGPIARDVEDLAPFVSDTVEMLNRHRPLLVETTQGYGLGLTTSRYYPRCTSREISTSQALSDCGLSPRSLANAFGVARTFPIRVAGDSGPLESEVTWEELRRDPELTTTTRRQRRIGQWERPVVARATAVCSIDAAVLTFADYLTPGNELSNVRDWATVMRWAGESLLKMEEDLGVPVRWVATGFGTFVEAPGGRISA